MSHITSTNSTPAIDITALHNAVKIDLQASTELLNLLQQEQEAIPSRNRDHLNEILTNKTACLQTIDNNANNRYQLLASIDQPPTEIAWKQIIEQQDDTALKADWEQLVDTLIQCRHCNEVNGRLINRGQQTLHQLLDILRGRLDPPTLYNQRGATESTAGGRSFTKA